MVALGWERGLGGSGVERNVERNVTETGYGKIKVS